MAERAATIPSSLYERDLYLWTQEQARLLREGRVAELDLAHLSEEIEGLGASEKREIATRMTVLLAHLLKWAFQPTLRSESWKSTLGEQRLSIEAVMEDSPSLRPHPARVLARAYRLARYQAARETGMSAADFPETCPFSLDDSLDRATSRPT